MRRVAATALLALGSCSHVGHGPAGGRLDGAQSWWILIGHIEDPLGIDWRKQTEGTDLVVLDGDAEIPVRELDPRTLALAYLSVGEANPSRRYWPAARAQGYLVEPNAGWDGSSFRVDVRDERWQTLLLDNEATRFIQRGFKGFMLDTLDTAAFLEEQDPRRFAGSRQALRDLLRRLRRDFPDAVLLANGTAGLADAAPFVDGYVVESVFARHSGGGYRRTTPEERAARLAEIDHVLASARRPVFSIDYAGSGDQALAALARDQARSRGFHPFVGVRALDRLPR